MLGDLDSAFEEALSAVETIGNPGLTLLLLFVISALIFGIPAVLKKTLKGVIIAIFCTTFATVGTYFILFKNCKMRDEALRKCNTCKGLGYILENLSIVSLIRVTCIKCYGKGSKNM